REGIGEPVDGGLQLPDGRVIPTDMGQVVPCIDSTDCQVGARCSSTGYCTQPGNEPCNTIDDCSLGEYCIEHSCSFPSIGNTCALADDCPEGSDCVNGQCVSADSACI